MPSPRQNRQESEYCTHIVEVLLLAGLYLRNFFVFLLNFVTHVEDGGEGDDMQCTWVWRGVKWMIEWVKIEKESVQSWTRECALHWRMGSASTKVRMPWYSSKALIFLPLTAHELLCAVVVLLVFLGSWFKHAWRHCHTSLLEGTESTLSNILVLKMEKIGGVGFVGHNFY